MPRDAHRRHTSRVATNTQKTCAQQAENVTKTHTHTDAAHPIDKNVCARDRKCYRKKKTHALAKPHTHDTINWQKRVHNKQKTLEKHPPPTLTQT